jgi:hypothetical protein
LEKPGRSVQLERLVPLEQLGSLGVLEKPGRSVQLVLLANLVSKKI